MVTFLEGLVEYSGLNPQIKKLSKIAIFIDFTFKNMFLIFLHQYMRAYAQSQKSYAINLFFVSGVVKPSSFRDKLAVRYRNIAILKKRGSETDTSDFMRLSSEAELPEKVFGI